MKGKTLRVCVCLCATERILVGARECINECVCVCVCAPAPTAECACQQDHVTVLPGCHSIPVLISYLSLAPVPPPPPPPRSPSLSLTVIPQANVAYVRGLGQKGTLAG